MASIFGGGPFGQGPFGSTPEVAVGLAGFEAASSLGVIGVKVDYQRNLVGFQSASSIGVLNERVDGTVTLAGFESTSTLGTIGPRIDFTFALNGFSMEMQPLGIFQIRSTSALFFLGDASVIDGLGVAAAPDTFIVGQLVTLAGYFVGEDGTPYDFPDADEAVACKVRLPDGTIVEPTVVHDDVLKRYIVKYVPEQNGLHEYRFEGTGDLPAASEGSFLAQTFFL